MGNVDAQGLLRATHIALKGSVLAGASVLLLASAPSAAPQTVGGPDAARPTFNRDIAPLLHSRCAACHRPGEAAPFSLLTYADARRRARQLAVVTESRYMPPWLPAPNPLLPFEGERSLSTEEIALIAAWAAAGAPEGDEDEAPRAPSWSEGWALGEPDLIVEMTEAYTLPADGPDVFRNFVMPVELPEDSPGKPPTSRWIRAVDLQPGNKRVVHHAVLNVDETLSSRRLDHAEAGAGFDGMYAFSEAHSPDGFFVGWTPGKVPNRGSDELSWRLGAGSDLVLQLHLQPSGKPEPVRARVGLYFADSPPARRPSLLRLGSLLLDIPAEDDSYGFSDSYELPVDVELLALYPHAHYLGKTMRAIAKLPDGSTLPLIEIPEWDFNWQDDYRCASPPLLPAGTRISIDYTYDNTSNNVLNPSRPPVRVRYGPRSEDEMGDLWLQVRALDETSRTRLERDWWSKDIGAQIEGQRYALSHNPKNAIAHAALGHFAVLAGRTDKAVEHLEKAVAIKPDYALAHTNLGWCLEQHGRLEEAREHYLAAIANDSFAADARNNLGFLSWRQGRREEALEHLRVALEIQPEHAGALNNTAQILASRGAFEEALALLERSTALKPENGEAHYNMGNVHLAMRRAGLAEAAYRRALELLGPSAPLRHNLGVALLHQERPEEAAEQLRAALSVDPEYAPAREKLARLREPRDGKK